MWIEQTNSPSFRGHIRGAEKLARPGTFESCMSVDAGGRRWIDLIMPAHFGQSGLDISLDVDSHIQAQHSPRVYHERYDARHDEDGNEEGCYRVKYGPARVPDQDCRYDDADGSQRILSVSAAPFTTASARQYQDLPP